MRMVTFHVCLKIGLLSESLSTFRARESVFVLVWEMNHLGEKQTKNTSKLKVGAMCTNFWHTVKQCFIIMWRCYDSVPIPRVSSKCLSSWNLFHRSYICEEFRQCVSSHASWVQTRSDDEIRNKAYINIEIWKYWTPNEKRMLLGYKRWPSNQVTLIGGSNSNAVFPLVKIFLSSMIIYGSN